MMLSVQRIRHDYYTAISEFLRIGRPTDDGDHDQAVPRAGSNHRKANHGAVWLGGVTEHFGIHGQLVDEEHFGRLCAGFHPTTKEPLVRNAGSENRCLGWDLFFSLPSSVESAWTSGNQKLKNMISNVFDQAVNETIEKIESEFAFCRVGRPGHSLQLKSAKICALKWAPYSKEQLSFKLRRHVTLLNLGLHNQSPRNFGGLYCVPFYRSKKVLGQTMRFNFSSNAEVLKHSFGVI